MACVLHARSSNELLDGLEVDKLLPKISGTSSIVSACASYELGLIQDSHMSANRSAGHDTISPVDTGKEKILRRLGQLRLSSHQQIFGE